MRLMSGFKVFSVLCSIFSPLIISAQAYADAEKTFPSVILRMGEKYQFFHSFKNNNNYKKFLLEGAEVDFTEPQDYNLGENPRFDWTPSVITNGYVIDPNAWDIEIITAKSDYLVQAYPSSRKSDNIVIKYKVEYCGDENRNGKLDAADNCYTRTDTQPYMISWCGDGIKDTPRSDETWIAESCDIADGVPTGKQCTTSCTLEDKPR